MINVNEGGKSLKFLGGRFTVKCVTIICFFIAYAAL